jgi:hypothetical protein
MTEFIINNFMTDIFAWMPRNDVNDTYKNAYKFLRMRHSLVSIMKRQYQCHMSLVEYVSQIRTTVLYDMNIVTPFFIVFTYQEIFGKDHLTSQLCDVSKNAVYEECEFYAYLDKAFKNTISQTLLPLI